jgi:hypothetical protein
MSEPVLDTRDYNAEMNELILEKIPADGDFIPSLAAWSIVSALTETDPELLDGWLRLHAKSFLTELMRAQLRSHRARVRSSAKATAFSSAAKRFEKNGDLAELGGWMKIRYVVDDQSTQRCLGDMDRNDLNFVASRYSRTAQTLLLEEAFHRALASRVGSLKVSEVFTEEQISAMYRNLSGNTHTATA